MLGDLLDQAIELVEAGDTVQAARLVKDYLRENPKDPAGWWVLAQVTEDASKQMEWVKRVLRLQPDHAEARALMIELGGEPPPLPQPQTSIVDTDTEISADETPRRRRGKKKDKQPKRQKPSKKKKSRPPGRGDWVASVVLFVVFNGLVAGGAWYGYTFEHLGLFGLFGPDLTNSADTQSFSINYPTEWQGSVVNDTVVVASDQDVDLEQMAQDLVPDVKPDQLIFSDGRLLAESLGLDGRVEEVVVMVMTPVTEEVKFRLFTLTDTVYLTAREFVEDQTQKQERPVVDEGIEAQIRSTRETIEIDGREWLFAYVIRDLRIGDHELHMGTYYALFNKSTEDLEAEEYLLIVSVFGNDADNHDDIVRRMLRTIEFK